MHSSLTCQKNSQMKNAVIVIRNWTNRRTNRKNTWTKTPLSYGEVRLWKLWWAKNKTIKFRLTGCLGWRSSQTERSLELAKYTWWQLSEFLLNSVNWSLRNTSFCVLQRVRRREVWKHDKFNMKLTAHYWFNMIDMINSWQGQSWTIYVWCAFLNGVT